MTQRKGRNRCALALTTGDRIEGTVLFAHPQRLIAVVAENMDGAIVHFGIDPAAGRSMISVWLSRWGGTAGETKAFAVRAQKALDQAFAATTAAT